MPFKKIITEDYWPAGLDAAKGANTKEGRFYWATDTGILYRDNGVDAWEPVDVASHLSGAGPPGVGTGDGYPIGSVYADTTADEGYVLTDNSAGANVWSKASAGASQPGEPNGFEDRSNCTLTWDNPTRTLTLTGTYNVWSDGTKYTKTNDSFQISDAEGDHFIYYDAAGDLQELLAFNIPLISQFAFVAYVYWDATNSEAVPNAVNEQHGSSMAAATHEYLHATEGTKYESGLALTMSAVDNTGDLDSHAQFSSAAGVIWDEDINHDVLSRAVSDNIPVLYKEGAAGNWRMNDSDSFPVITTGTGRAAWNEFTGGAWQLTETTNNDFVLAHIYAVPGVNEDNGYLVAVMGQAEYPALGQARDGAVAEIVTLNAAGLPFQEFKEVATIILQTSDGSTNAVKSKVVSTDTGDDYVDWRLSDFSSAGVSSTSAAWGNISGTLSNQTDLQAALDAKGPAPLSGAGVPGVATGDGYPIGTVYADTTANESYVLTDNTTGANVWSTATGTGGGGGSISVLDDAFEITAAVESFDFAGAGLTLSEPTPNNVKIVVNGGENVGGVLGAWKFSTADNAATDPGFGSFKANNTDTTLITEFYFSNYTTAGLALPVDEVFALGSKIVIQSMSDYSDAVFCEVTLFEAEPVVAEDWCRVTVTVLSSSGAGTWINNRRHGVARLTAGGGVGTATAGLGLVGGGGDVIDVGEGTGIKVNADSIEVDEPAVDHNNLLAYDFKRHRRIFTGAGVPTAGAIGGETLFSDDLYLQQDAAKLYYYANDVWVQVVNGAANSNFLTGAVDPADGSGNPGDFYYNTVGQTFWYRDVQAAWDGPIGGTEVPSATTSVEGTVLLAADGGTTAGTVVQADDSRLAGGGGVGGPLLAVVNIRSLTVGDFHTLMYVSSGNTIKINTVWHSRDATSGAFTFDMYARAFMPADAAAGTTIGTGLSCGSAIGFTAGTSLTNSTGLTGFIGIKIATDSTVSLREANITIEYEYE